MKSAKATWFGITTNDLMVHLGVIGLAMALVLPGLVARGAVGGIGTTICIVGALATAALAVLGYVLTRRTDDAPRLSLRDWFVKRGIIYVLSQAPIAAIYSGFFFRVVPFGVSVLWVIVSFLLLLVWISYRKSRTTDPDEPVHHIHKYVLYALLPCVMFSVARIPTHMHFGFAYWHPWYDFGSDFTGLAPHHYSSLAVGALLYTMDGLVLTVGYYVLFQRHSLTNAVLYICLYISAIYCFTFPAYGRIGMASPAMWHAVVYWAHLAMAVAAFAMPFFYRRVWPRLRIAGRTGAVAVITMVLASPYAYAAYQAKNLQWPKQHKIDSALFERELISKPEIITVATVDGDARYELAINVGPRSYKNWVKRTRVLDVRDLEYSARLIENGRTIAWCSGYAAELEPVNDAAFDADFMQKVKAKDYARVSVQCSGPARPSTNLDAITVEWRAAATLIGDRERTHRIYQGSTKAVVATPAIVATK